MIYADDESEAGVSQGAESQDFQFADWSRHPAGGPKTSNEAFSLFKSNLKSAAMPGRCHCVGSRGAAEPQSRLGPIRPGLGQPSIYYDGASVPASRSRSVG